MLTYLSLLQEILDNGQDRPDRTGTGTISVFGTKRVYDLKYCFPAVTTKRLAWKAVVSELLWFIEGSNDERRLCEILHGSRDPKLKTVWTDNANASYWLNNPNREGEGDLGRVYGVQWRSWGNSMGDTTDQLKDLVWGLKHDPYGRRHIISAWNPGELNYMALPPCHCFAQFYVNSDNTLDCQMYQRSVDVFLGAPFNIASYSLFTCMLAQVCGLTPGKFIHIGGDTHIYKDHIEQVRTQLAREPYSAPKLVLNTNIMDITKFTMRDIALDHYFSHSAIKAPMAV